MAEDASLDDFLGGSDGETESESDDGTADASDTTASETPAPATTTYAWDGDGAACASCGEGVEKRWLQDGTLVCVDCKRWAE